MSSKHRIKNTFRLPPFVPITWETLNSDAYRSLTPSAAKALPYFIGKDGKSVRKTGGANPEVEFTYAEANRLGFANRTFSRVIQELVAKGFIDPVEHGGLRGYCKSTNKFRVSGRWKHYGKHEFKALSWKTSEPVEKGRLYDMAA